MMFVWLHQESCCVMLATHFVVGNAGDHTRIMTQHLRGIFNWELEQWEQLAAQQDSSQHKHSTGNGNMPASYSSQPGAVKHKKSQLEGLLNNKIQSLQNEQVYQDDEFMYPLCESYFSLVAT